MSSDLSYYNVIIGGSKYLFKNKKLFFVSVIK